MRDIDFEKHRVRNFAVRVEPINDPSVEDEFRVEVTYNGRQWHGISMSPTESKAIIRAIRKHTKKYADTYRT